MSSDIAPAAYTRWIAIVGLMLVPVVASVVNIVVDPYGIWNIVTIDELNKEKPLLRKHDRLHKAYRVRTLKPDTLLMGTSRGAWGLDPEYSALGDKAYNLSILGGSMTELTDYLVHANETGDVDTVILGVDLFMFDAERVPPTDAPRTYLSRFDATFGWQRYRAVLTASSDTLQDSLRTTRDQDTDPRWILFDANGSIRGDRNRTLVHSDGGYAKRFRVSLSTYVTLHYLPPPDQVFHYGPADKNPNLEAFRSFVAYCHRNDIDAQIFISPSHARQFDLIDILGLWDVFERWKRDLVEINSDHSDPFPVWDFSGFNDYTTEAVPTDETTDMEYYVDSSHYTHALGDAVLDRLLDSSLKASDFGRRLTPESIDAALAELRDERDRWQHSKPLAHAEVVAIANAPTP